MKIKRVAAVEFDDRLIKVFHYRLDKHAPAALASGFVETDVADEEKAAADLRRLLDSLKIQPPWAIACFSRRHATLRTLNLPSTDPKEIRNMVGFQAMKQVPFSKEEIVLDYSVLGKTAQGYSKVLLVIVHKKVALQALGILERAGLSAVSLRLNAQEAAAWYARRQGKGASLFVDFDAESTEFVAVEAGMHLFSRSGAVAKVSLSSGDAAPLQRLLTETENSIALFKREEPEIPLQRIVLVNPPPTAAKTLCDRARDWKLPVETWETPPGAAAEKVSFSALRGVGERIDSPALNFLPESLAGAARGGAREKNLARWGAVAVGSLLLLSGFLYLKNLELESRNGTLQKQIVSTQPQARRLEAMKKKIRLVESQSHGQNFSLDILAEIYRLIPNEISLDSFAYDAHTGVGIKGTAVNLSDIFNWIPRLEESPFFEKVASKGTSSKKIKEKVFIDFHLDIPFQRERTETPR